MPLVILGGDVDLGVTSAWVLQRVGGRFPAGENDLGTLGRRGAHVVQPDGELVPDGSQTRRRRHTTRERARLHDVGMPRRGYRQTAS